MIIELQKHYKTKEKKFYLPFNIIDVKFFLINVGIRASLCAPRLISRALKLTTMQASNNYHISNHRGQILWFQILITRSPTR
jgi:hypothetical protein